MIITLCVVAGDQQLMQGATGLENVELGLHTLLQGSVIRTETLEVAPAEPMQIEVGVRLKHPSLAFHASDANDPVRGTFQLRSLIRASDVSATLTNPKSNEPLHLHSDPEQMQEANF